MYVGCLCYHSECITSMTEVFAHWRNLAFYHNQLHTSHMMLHISISFIACFMYICILPCWGTFCFVLLLFISRGLLSALSRVLLAFTYSTGNKYWRTLVWWVDTGNNSQRLNLLANVLARQTSWTLIFPTGLQLAQAASNFIQLPKVFTYSKIIGALH